MSVAEIEEATQHLTFKLDDEVFAIDNYNKPYLYTEFLINEKERYIYQITRSFI